MINLLVSALPDIRKIEKIPISSYILKPFFLFYSDWGLMYTEGKEISHVHPRVFGLSSAATCNATHACKPDVCVFDFVLRTFILMPP